MNNTRISFSIRFYKEALITAGLVLSTGSVAWSANNTLLIDQQDISTSVDNSSALYVENGGYAQVTNSTLTASGAVDNGFYATGSGTLLDLENSKIITNANAGSAAVIRDGAHANLYQVDVHSTMRGIDAIGASFKGEDIHVITNGHDGIYSGKDASGWLKNSQIKVSGLNGTAAFADAGYLNVQDAEIILLDNSTAFATENNGVLELQGGEITGKEGGTLFDIRHSGTLSAEDFKAKLSKDSGDVNNTFLNFNYTTENTNLYFNHAQIDISGQSALGIMAEKSFGHVNIDNTRLSLPEGTAIIVGNKSDFTVNLNHAEILSKTLLVNRYTDGDADFIPQTLALHANNGSVLQGNVSLLQAKNQHHQISLDNGSLLQGRVQGLHSLTLDHNSRWEITADSSLDDLKISHSELSFDRNTGGFKTLTIAGDYAAENAKMSFNGALADDSSPTDKVHILGSSSGVTDVVVNNVGGKGAQTVEGITLIHVDGEPGGTFRQAGRIVAGAYDYTLQQSKDRQRWILTSAQQLKLGLPDPDEPGSAVPLKSEKPGETTVLVQQAEPVNGDTAPQPAIEANSETAGEKVQPVNSNTAPVTSTEEAATRTSVVDTGTKTQSSSTAPSLHIAAGESKEPIHLAEPVAKAMIVRPEAAGYLANAAAANTLFGAALSDRLYRGDEKLWLRSVAGRNQFTESSRQIATHGHYAALILGTDVLDSRFSASDRLRVGVMAGTGQAQNGSRSSVTGYQARSSTRGYGFGAYANWQQRERDQNGAYIDSWLMYNTFANSVSGEGLGQEHYRSHGFTGANELGYRAKVASFNTDFALWLQPKASVSWHGVSAGAFKERNGTRVNDRTARGLQTSLGLRASLLASENVNTALLPSVEVNWIHNSSAPSVSLDGAKVMQAGVDNRMEVKAGIDARMNKNASLWAGAAYQQGAHGYRDTRGVVGLKVNF